MRTITRDVVAAILVSKDGKIFQGMKHPGKGGVYVDCWHIPGGGIDEGETAEQALVREVREETGIDITSYQIELVDDQGNGEAEKTLKDTGEKVLCKMNFLVYRVDITDERAEDIEVKLEDDLEKCEWVDITELRNRKLTPPSIELFKRLGYIDKYSENIK